MKATKKIIEKPESSPPAAAIGTGDGRSATRPIAKAISPTMKMNDRGSAAETSTGAAVDVTDGDAAGVVRVSCAVTAAPPVCSPRVLEVAAMFGLGVDESREMTIVPPCEIPIPSPGIVFITGPSGSGKSTILRLLARMLAERGDRVIDVHAMANADRRTAGHLDIHADATEHDLIKSLSEIAPGSPNNPRPPASAPTEAGSLPLIDRVGGDLRGATSLLSHAGLGDAFVMLRREAELSDGQRFRFRLALAMEQAIVPPSPSNAGMNSVQLSLNPSRSERPPINPESILRFLAKNRNKEGGGDGVSTPSSRCVIIADEFAATLDRLTAKTIARNVRRWINRASRDHGAHITFIAATTHDDLLEPLHPDVLVVKELGEHVEVMTR